MLTMQTSTTLLGVVLALLIIYLIRRDHLYLMHGLLWFTLAGATALLGAWPGLIDMLAVWFGFAYPPAFLLLLACMLLLLKALHADMLCTRLECDLRRINQRLALLELAQQNPGELPDALAAAKLDTCPPHRPSCH